MKARLGSSVWMPPCFPSFYDNLAQPTYRRRRRNRAQRLNILCTKLQALNRTSTGWLVSESTLANTQRTKTASPKKCFLIRCFASKRASSLMCIAGGSLGSQLWRKRYRKMWNLSSTREEEWKQLLRLFCCRCGLPSLRTWFVPCVLTLWLGACLSNMTSSLRRLRAEAPKQSHSSWQRRESRLCLGQLLLQSG